MPVIFSHIDRNQNGLCTLDEDSCLQEVRALQKLKDHPNAANWAKGPHKRIASSLQAVWNFGSCADLYFLSPLLHCPWNLKGHIATKSDEVRRFPSVIFVDQTVFCFDRFGYVFQHRESWHKTDGCHFGSRLLIGYPTFFDLVLFSTFVIRFVFYQFDCGHYVDVILVECGDFYLYFGSHQFNDLFWCGSCPFEI